ncbi:MAG: OmcA/MtrC family decaheme c-type cytochrome [Planctomycetota bacterium]
MAELDVVSEITGVTIASPPVVTFTLKTAGGSGIEGLVPLWEASSGNRYVRFTITKLVVGQNGDPDSWVAYTRDATSGDPDYDTGSSLVDNGGGSYTFTFNTDVANVAGVPYEPTLTHRVAGQIGSSSEPLEPQNLWLDFVPTGAAVTRTRNIAVMATCNECHDDLVFHGRRFEVEYCVQCHNPDLADGEGNFSFMIHRIHNAGKFFVLDNAISYEELTYPQDVNNCRKCHNGDDTATAQGNNWRVLPNMAACDGCHDIFNPNAANTHTGGTQTSNQTCSLCHSSTNITEYHTTPNATLNNPELLSGQRKITYEMIDAVVDGSNNVIVQFKVLSDGTPLQVSNLPTDMKDGSGDAFRYAGLLLAWAETQDGITTPGDYNNLGGRAGQPISLDLGDFSPIEPTTPVGALTYNATTGVNTATVNTAANRFPVGAKLRAVGLQGYFQQDLDSDGSSDVSLHTPSMVVAVTGDTKRRTVVDNDNCSKCHEWFEGHGGNRTYNIAICTLCHVPNLSSTGRSVVDETLRDLDDDIQAAVTAGDLPATVVPSNPRTYPEDAQNLKDLVHGIHSSGFRTRSFQHVRGPTRQGYYDWSHVTFPRGASTSKCTLCHEDDTYELPLASNLLSTTVRTTGQANGLDADLAAAEAAFVGVPNVTDWVNSPTGSSCFYCHTSDSAWAHMSQNGALLSHPDIQAGRLTNRSALPAMESCATCHGPGKFADLEDVHNK